MILYRKASPLRVRRVSVPEPPFWCASVIAPYAARRTTPIAIDYIAQRAVGAERLEVTVTERVRDELERMKALPSPVLIDAAETSELVFRRGAEALTFCAEQSLDAVYLTSTDGALLSEPRDGVTTVIAAWPLVEDRLRVMFAAARGSWGVVVPVIYPVTTDLDSLEALAVAAQRSGAAFFAALPVIVEPTARQALAQLLDLTGEDDRYAMLFHGNVDPLHVATERHIAALAADCGMADFVLPPRWNERTNWNASVLLALVASRMYALEMDLDLAGQIARTARVIAELDKSLSRIVESARLTIIGGIDETSAGMLEQWMRGETPAFAAFVDEQWRLRRIGSGSRES